MGSNFRWDHNCGKRLLYSLCMSVRLSVCMVQLVSYWKEFHGISCLKFFRKSVKKILVSLKSDKNNEVLYMKTNIHFLIMSCSFILKMRNISHKFVEKIRTYIFCSITSFKKLLPLLDKIEKRCRAIQAIDEDKAQAHCNMGT